MKNVITAIMKNNQWVHHTVEVTEKVLDAL